MTVTQTTTIVPDVYPTLRYQDATAAIEWLENAFGFKRVVVYPDGDGGVAHAELAFGNGAVMLGSLKQAAGQARTNGGEGISEIYLRVDDVQSHFNRAKAYGAEIVRDFQPTEYDTAGTYSARDPEGHVWSFGSYGPELTLTD